MDLYYFFLEKKEQNYFLIGCFNAQEQHKLCCLSR